MWTALGFGIVLFGMLDLKRQLQETREQVAALHRDMWTALGFGILFFWMLELQRRIRETSEEVSRLHKDFIAEVYMRYGENYNGKK